MQVQERFCDSFSKDILCITSELATELKMYPSVQKSLNNIIINEGYIFCKILTRAVSTNGGNYLGQLYEVNVRGITSKGPKETNIFVKQIISGDFIKDIVDVNNSYINEIFFYTELGKMFNELQETAHIPEDIRFKLVKSYDESNTNAILLENLTKKGFKTLNRMDVIPIKFAYLSIQQLAKFHALSFVSKHKTKELFENNITKIKPTHQFGESWKNFAKRIVNYSLDYFNNDIKNRIKIFTCTLLEKQPKYLKGDITSVRCVCHGDFRINNLLFKDEGNIEVALVDFQLIYYGSPVMDLLYFFYTSTDRNFRKTHMSDLKNLYHTTLTHFLKYFDLDVNNVYPRHVFEKDFEDYQDYGLMLALCLLPFCLVVEDEIPDIAKDNIDDLTPKLDDRFKTRISEIIDEYLDLGIL